ncbi:hypothetical protein Nepgr_011972 [Nepenthes gracilis]|uniref:Uncharacterized protein n=1 Tax=Nepenthes gracilis TaxID=150966 RepID=A0AAD3SG56_NEPGR|nr:hypothetical protein Nepgr_011972 [Nepenthes gracilis]
MAIIGREKEGNSGKKKGLQRIEDEDKYLSWPAKDHSYYENQPKSSAIKLIDYGSTAYEHQDHNYVVSNLMLRSPRGYPWSWLELPLWPMECMLHTY